MKCVETVKVEIYVGFREEYTNEYHTYQELVDICTEYVTEVGLCVSIEKVDFVYVSGQEPGAKITLINYPRFPSNSTRIILTASRLGSIIMKQFKQYRVSIVTEDKTFMLENEELKA